MSQLCSKSNQTAQESASRLRQVMMLEAKSEEGGEGLAIFLAWSTLNSAPYEIPNLNVALPVIQSNLAVDIASVLRGQTGQ